MDGWMDGWTDACVCMHACMPACIDARTQERLCMFARRHMVQFLPSIARHRHANPCKLSPATAVTPGRTAHFILTPTIPTSWIQLAEPQSLSRETCNTRNKLETTCSHGKARPPIHLSHGHKPRETLSLSLSPRSCLIQTKGLELTQFAHVSSVTCASSVQVPELRRTIMRNIFMFPHEPKQTRKNNPKPKPETGSRRQVLPGPRLQTASALLAPGPARRLAAL